MSYIVYIAVSLYSVESKNKYIVCIEEPIRLKFCKTYTILDIISSMVPTIGQAQLVSSHSEVAGLIHHTFSTCFVYVVPCWLLGGEADNKQV